MCHEWHVPYAKKRIISEHYNIKTFNRIELVPKHASNVFLNGYTRLCFRPFCTCLNKTNIAFIYHKVSGLRLVNAFCYSSQLSVAIIIYKKRRLLTFIFQ